MTADFTTPTVRQSEFELALATTFEIAPFPDSTDGAATIQATLEVVTARSSPTEYEQFSAMFRGPVEPLLAQGIYFFRHADLGEFPLFMVPVACDASGAVYEVCVSQSR
jgi:hypothetical protein